MAGNDWDIDIVVWQRANDLLQQAERIHRNLLEVAAGARYRSSTGRTPSWEPPVNVVETDASMWVIAALPGVTRERMDVRLQGRELVITGSRPLPACCEDGELKIWEMPLGRFERRLGLVSGDRPVSVGEVSLHDGLLIIELRKQS